MAKNRKKKANKKPAKVANKMLAIVRTPMFRMRVVANKTTKYKRNVKHRGQKDYDLVHLLLGALNHNPSLLLTR